MFGFILLSGPFSSSSQHENSRLSHFWWLLFVLDNTCWIRRRRWSRSPGLGVHCSSLAKSPTIPHWTLKGATCWCRVSVRSAAWLLAPSEPPALVAVHWQVFYSWDTLEGSRFISAYECRPCINVFITEYYSFASITFLWILLHLDWHCKQYAAFSRLLYLEVCSPAGCSSWQTGNCTFCWSLWFRARKSLSPVCDRGGVLIFDSVFMLSIYHVWKYCLQLPPTSSACSSSQWTTYETCSTLNELFVITLCLSSRCLRLKKEVENSTKHEVQQGTKINAFLWDSVNRGLNIFF